MSPRIEIGHAVFPPWQIDVAEAPRVGEGEDRVAFDVDPHGAFIAVADGSGGRAGGAAAADRLIAAARAAAPRDAAAMMDVISSVDVALAHEADGETAAVLVRLYRDGSVLSVGVGDSGALILDGATWIDTRESQPRKPLVGSGVAVPVAVKSSRCDALVVATDGLLAYARWDAIVGLAGSDDPHAVRALVDAARLPSGGLSDDVAVVLARRRAERARG